MKVFTDRWVLGALALAACGGGGETVAGTSGTDGGSTGGSASGGAAGTNAGGSSASAGSNGTGGSSATLVDCVKDRPFQNSAEVSPDIRKTISGTNGTFTDACDASGNLVEYACANGQVCTPGPNPSCMPGPETGEVVPQTFDCLGHCNDGSCPSRCPQAGDKVHFDGIGGASGRQITVRNLTDGRRFTCEDPSGPPPADDTCHQASLVGTDVGVIQSVPSGCTGAFGNLTLDIKANCGVPNCNYCAYVSCVVVYGP